MEEPQRPALGTVRAALDEARTLLAGADTVDPASGAVLDTQTLATVTERLLEALEGIVVLVDGPIARSDKAANAAVVEGTMSAGGPKFDRARPRRGYGQGQ